MMDFARQFFRFNIAIVLAALVTLLLFYFMQYLIAVSDNGPQRLTVTRLIDARVPEFEMELFTEIAPPPPIEEPLPPSPDILTRTPVDGGFGPTTDTQVRLNDISMPGISITLSDNVMVPLIRTTANYPQRALARGIEGFVELGFTVDAEGNVVDPVVLYAEPEGMFERSALQSIRRWKYAAAVEDGSPVATTDVRQRIVFQLEK